MLTEGFTTIHQELSAVSGLTALDHIFLGRELNSWILGANIKPNRGEGYGQYRESLRNVPAPYADVVSSDEFGALVGTLCQVTAADSVGAWVGVTSPASTEVGQARCGS